MDLRLLFTCGWKKKTGSLPIYDFDVFRGRFTWSIYGYQVLNGINAVDGSGGFDYGLFTIWLEIDCDYQKAR